MELMALSCSRDRALMLLIEASWSQGLAGARWAEESTMAQPVVGLQREQGAPSLLRVSEADAGPLPPAPSPQAHTGGRQRLCLLGCGRPQNASTTQCCISCPAHTPACRRRWGERQASSASAPTSASSGAVLMHGYVVLRTRGSQEAMLGLHRCSWAELETRLQVPRGQLAGRLRQHRVELRRVSTEEDARAWWGQRRLAEPMPQFP